MLTFDAITMDQLDSQSDTDRLQNLLNCLKQSDVIALWEHDATTNIFNLEPIATTIWTTYCKDNTQTLNKTSCSLPHFLLKIHEDYQEKLKTSMYHAMTRSEPMHALFCFKDDETQMPFILKGHYHRPSEGYAVKGTGLVMRSEFVVNHDYVQNHPERMLNTIADTLIALYPMVKALRKPQLTKTLDRLMLELGHQLAEILHNSDYVVEH